MKNLILVYLVAITTILAFAGCPSQPVKMNGMHTMRAAGIVSVTASWVKDKPKKFDTGFKITNESKTQPIIIFAGDISCSRGDVKGELTIDNNPRVIDVRPNEARSLLLKCNLHAESSGDFHIDIAKVFANPKQDSMTPGEVLLENLNWKQGQREGGVIH